MWAGHIGTLPIPCIIIGMKKTPTIRQKKLAQRLVENGGKSVSASMREVGYSDAYAKNPNKIIQSRTWQELMDEYLPDDLIAEKHKALLTKTDALGEIDVNAVKAGVDMGYKVKKKYELPEQTIILKKYEDLTDEELEETINAKLIKGRKDRTS